MKSNPKPNPFHYSSGLGTRLKNDPQVKKWAKRLIGDPEAKPTDLSESELAFVYSEVLKLRGELGNQQLFEKAMHDTCPVLAAPDWTDNAEDMGHVLLQPETQALWDAWDPAQSPTAPDIDFSSAKAVLMTLSMCGFTSYFDDALEHYSVNQKLQDVFAGANGGPVRRHPAAAPGAAAHRRGPGADSRSGTGSHSGSHPGPCTAAAVPGACGRTHAAGDRARTASACVDTEDPEAEEPDAEACASEAEDHTDDGHHRPLEHARRATP